MAALKMEIDFISFTLVLGFHEPSKMGEVLGEAVGDMGVCPLGQRFDFDSCHLFQLCKLSKKLINTSIWLYTQHSETMFVMIHNGKLCQY